MGYIFTFSSNCNTVNATFENITDFLSFQNILKNRTHHFLVLPISDSRCMYVNIIDINLFKKNLATWYKYKPK